jgi:Rrf2 family protein
MAQGQGLLHTATSLSAKTNLPEPTVAKVLKLLTRGGLIVSARGVNGGYRLTKAAEEISLASVIQALEGPVQLTACVEGNDKECLHAVNCTMKGKWDPVNAAMRKALEDVTLAQMMAAAPRKELQA